MDNTAFVDHFLARTYGKGQGVVPKQSVKKEHGVGYDTESGAKNGQGIRMAASQGSSLSFSSSGLLEKAASPLSGGLAASPKLLSLEVHINILQQRLGIILRRE